MSVIKDYILEYVRKALSLTNRKKFDGDSNAPYRVVIEMAEVGAGNESDDEEEEEDGEEEEEIDGDETGNFWFNIKIPRQVDNCLGCTVDQTVHSRKRAVAILEELIVELKKKPGAKPRKKAAK